MKNEEKYVQPIETENLLHSSRVNKNFKKEGKPR